MLQNKKLLVMIILVAGLVLSACSGAGPSAQAEPAQDTAPVAEASGGDEAPAEPAESDVGEADTAPEPAEVEPAQVETTVREAEPAEAEAAPVSGNYPAWASVPLTDVRSGETFTLDSFAGQVVIMEMMAVWCPFCDQQQIHIKQAIEQLGDGVVGVSLDVDPGESEDIVIAHANELGLPWHFVLAGSEMASLLRAEYGPQVLTPPATPVIILGPDGTAQLTPSGIKNSARLIEIVNQMRQ